MSMPLADLIFLAFALSVDAFVVAFSYGLLIKQKRLSNGIKLSLSTGAGQFLMPVLGFLLTGSVHRYIAVSYTHLDVYKRQPQVFPDFTRGDWKTTTPLGIVQ